MDPDKEIAILTALGARLRESRLARNEPMDMFARRIGVSVPTLRHMEAGAATVAIGHWIRALDVLGRLDDVDHVLVVGGGLLERARAGRTPTRRRARRRTAAPA